MSGHADANSWVSLIENYWWLGLIFAGSIGAFFEGVGEWFTHAGRVRHKRRVQIEKIRARAALAAAQPEPQALPGQCVHRRVVPVIATGDDKPTAWLCKGCDTQLPADWAVRAEDL